MAFIAALIALLPGFAWLYFYLREDPHPEPKTLIAKVFIAGAACAFVALAVQIFLKNHGFDFDVRGGMTGKLLLVIIVYSLIEELAKFGAAYVTVHDDPAFDEPVDAMIYMVVAALGFATIENMGAVQQDVGLFLGSSQTLNLILQTLTLRFVGATLLHTLSSALIGYYWAQEIRNFRSGSWLLWGIVMGTGLHALFNYLIISYGSLIYAVGLVVVMGISVLGNFERLRLKTI